VSQTDNFGKKARRNRSGRRGDVPLGFHKKKVNFKGGGKRTTGMPTRLDNVWKNVAGELRGRGEKWKGGNNLKSKEKKGVRGDNEGKEM